MRSLSSHLSPTLDLFSENNTTYAVYEYIEGIKLVDYLKENAGELSWSEVSAMFPPLFTTLSLVHNAGVIHRGISPETIYVTDKGELKLTDFCISGLRTVGTELSTEIYDGYAAPEQYSAASRQGTWTDVYGICSVLYRILTGSKPDAANIRLENDNLYTPQDLNPNIPRHVSDVIMTGMDLAGENRIQTITELVTRLFDQPAAGFSKTQTLQISRDGIMETNQTYGDGYDDGYYGDGYDDGYDGYDDYDDSGNVEVSGERNSSIDKIKVPIIIGILLVAIVIVIVVILFQLFSGGNNPSNIRESVSVSDSSSKVEEVEETTEPTQETEQKNKMPSLVGKKLDDIRDKFEEKYKVTLEYTSEDNEDYPEGVIFWQDLEIGQTVEEGMTINVKVSKGSSKATVPEFENWPLEDFIELCKSYNIQYATVSEINPDVENGYVTRVSPDPGSSIDIKNDILTIYYADNPEETEPPTEEETPPPQEQTQQEPQPEQQDGGEQFQ